jgi:hypothetical protein
MLEMEVVAEPWAVARGGGCYRHIGRRISADGDGSAHGLRLRFHGCRGANSDDKLQ